MKIRRPRPSPRQGRRLGPPQVWNLSFLATGIPRPHQWLLMGVQACRLPGLKRLKGLKPLKLCKSFSERPTAQAKATPRPHPSLLMGVQARRYTLETLPTLQHSLGMPNPAANKHSMATSMASYGRPSLPFASPENPPCNSGPDPGP